MQNGILQQPLQITAILSTRVHVCACVHGATRDNGVEKYCWACGAVRGRTTPRWGLPEGGLVVVADHGADGGWKQSASLPERFQGLLCHPTHQILAVGLRDYCPHMLWDTHNEVDESLIGPVPHWWVFLGLHGCWCGGGGGAAGSGAGAWARAASAADEDGGTSSGSFFTLDSLPSSFFTLGCLPSSSSLPSLSRFLSFPFAFAFSFPFPRIMCGPLQG